MHEYRTSWDEAAIEPEEPPDPVKGVPDPADCCPWCGDEDHNPSDYRVCRARLYDLLHEDAKAREDQGHDVANLRVKLGEARTLLMDQHAEFSRRMDESRTKVAQAEADKNAYWGRMGEWKAKQEETLHSVQEQARKDREVAAQIRARMESLIATGILSEEDWSGLPATTRPTGYGNGRMDWSDNPYGLTGPQATIPDCCPNCGEDHEPFDHHDPEDEMTCAETRRQGEIYAQIQQHKKAGNLLYALIWELQGKVHACDDDEERDRLLLAQRLCFDFYKQVGGYETCKPPAPKPRLRFWPVFAIGLIAAVVGYFLWPILFIRTFSSANAWFLAGPCTLVSAIALTAYIGTTEFKN